MNNEILTQTIARYVMSLYSASQATHYAEDRPLYRIYLEQAGVLLALSVTDADQKEIQRYIGQHERTWGYTFLQDPVYKEPEGAWQEVKRIASRTIGPADK